MRKEDIYAALNRLRDAFLAAKDGNEVEEIINGLLTPDEKLKIGRRILVAEYVKNEVGLDEIVRMLKVGKNTIISVTKSLEKHPHTFDLIDKRKEKVEKEYAKRKYRFVGGSTVIFKKKEYTGIKRKNIER